jgi:chorismate mutase/prephenate dehydratase
MDIFDHGGHPGDSVAQPLEDLRRRIDALDTEIARLLQERARVSLAVGESKRVDGSASVFVPDREAEVLGHVQSIPGPLDARALGSIYREVLSASRALQRPIRVAYLGPAATFGHQAAREQFGSRANFEPCPTHGDVFDAVERGAADLGVVGFENSTEGPVLEVLDRFVDSPLQVCAEVNLPVSLTLLGRTTCLASVERVLAHPQAAAQARGWLATHLPGVSVEAATSNGRGAELASQDASGRTAAIASRLAAEVYGLDVLAESIQDLSGNVTRFVVLARAPSEQPTGRDKTALVFSIHDRVGALRDLTHAFSMHAVNLSSIQSRPSKRRAWDYLFFVELDGHLAEPRVQAALERARAYTVFLKVLGSWPAPPSSGLLA